MNGAWFVTGTDTGVGKTLVACALLEAARRRGHSTLGLKPVAAGGSARDPEHNADVLQLQRYSSVRAGYAELNPAFLRLAIAPSIAALQEGRCLRARELAAACRPGLQSGAEFVVVEGAGGWSVPLNDTETMGELARLLGLPVVLVVGMRLGCLNHALLSAAQIRQDGLQLAAWVANSPESREMDFLPENAATLERTLGCPCLGRVPPLSPPAPEAAADCLELSRLERG